MSKGAHDKQDGGYDTLKIFPISIWHTPAWQLKRKQRKLCVLRITESSNKQVYTRYTAEGQTCQGIVHKDKQCVILAHREAQGWADKWIDIAAVIGGKRNQSKLFQHMQAVTDCVRAAHRAMTTAMGQSLGEALGQDTKDATNRSHLRNPSVCTMCCTNEEDPGGRLQEDMGCHFGVAPCPKWYKQSETP
jgi:hypothetical protein